MLLAVSEDGSVNLFMTCSASCLLHFYRNGNRQGCLSHQLIKVLQGNLSRLCGGFACLHIYCKPCLHYNLARNRRGDVVCAYLAAYCRHLALIFTRCNNK